jgi:hypothetical protein
VGTAAFGCPSPKGATLFDCAAANESNSFLLDVSVISALNLRRRRQKAAAGAAGQPKAAVSTKFLALVIDLDQIQT